MASNSVFLLAVSSIGAMACLVEVPGDHTYDLSPIAGRNYSAPYYDATYNVFKLDFSLCSDSIACDPSRETGGNETGTLTVTDAREGRCFVGAKWRLNAAAGTSVAKLVNTGDMGFTVTFTNGDLCGNDARAAVYTFICELDTEVRVDGNQNPECVYNINIHTRYACPPCSFNVKFGEGAFQIYDFAALSQLSLNLAYKQDDHAYGVVVGFCKNTRSCTSTSGEHHASDGAVTRVNEEGDCEVLCRWDPQDAQTTNLYNGVRVEFSNGNACGLDKHSCVYTFTCSSQLIGNVTMSEQPKCQHNFYVPTKYACATRAPRKSSAELINLARSLL